MREQRRQTLQAATAELRLEPAKSARFSGPVPSDDRLCLYTGGGHDLRLSNPAKGAIFAPKSPGIGRMSDTLLRTVEAMSGPTPQTHFEAWGQALIGITNSNSTVVDEYKKGLLALIMIADTNREWAAWYYFTSKYELDIQLMQHYVSEVLAEKPKFPSHFTTPKAMTVEELCGNNLDLTTRWRRASLMGPPRDIGNDNFELILLVQSAPPAQGSQDRIGDQPTTKPIHLRFKQRDGASEVTEYPLGFGWLNYARISEAYNFLAPYHSKHEKLRAMEKMLLNPQGPQIRLGI